MDISILVGLLNNLDYSKHFYKTFRSIYPNEELVFVSYGSSDGTNEWLDQLKLEDSRVMVYYSDERKTLADTYNKAAFIATKRYQVFLHNDIVVTDGFLENIEKYLHDYVCVTYTTIEPPIFAGHSRAGKIIEDFGVDLETFDIEKFKQKAKEYQDQYKDQEDMGWAFFMAMNRKKYLKMGGMDNLFNPYFLEDDDVKKRLDLNGFDFIVSLDAICYHFVSKTSRFSEEAKSKTQQIELNSMKNYIRKWGGRQFAKHKYNIGFKIKNCTSYLLEQIEPFCDTCYVDDFEQSLSYINNHQSETKFNLTEKIKHYDSILTNDIILQFDGNEFNQNSFTIINQLSNIITESGQVGKFKLDCFDVIINSMETYENQLINLS